jgi:hypothetical protein
MALTKQEQMGVVTHNKLSSISSFHNRILVVVPLNQNIFLCNSRAYYNSDLKLIKLWHIKSYHHKSILQKEPISPSYSLCNKLEI